MSINPNKSYRRILHSSAIMGAASVVNILAGIVKMKLAAVLLGPMGVGQIGLLQNILQTASMVSALGVGSVGARQIAAAEGENSNERIVRARLALFWGTMILASVGAGIFLILSEWIAKNIVDDPAARGEIVWLAVGLALSVAASAQTAYLTGMQRIGDVARIRAWSGIAAATLGMIAIWFWGSSAIVIVVLLVPVTMFLTGHYYVARLGKPEGRRPTFPELLNEWRGLVLLGLSFMASQVTMSLAQLGVRTLVQDYEGADGLGQFQASFSIGMIYLTFILGAMSTDYFPRLSAIIKDREAARRLVNEQTEVALLLCGPALLAMLALAPWVIQLLYSLEFAPATNILRWQLLGDLLKVITWPLGFVILALGAGRSFLLVQIAGALTLVGVSALLLPTLGVVATGIAFIAMYMVILPSNYFLSRRKIGFRWSATVLKQSFALMVAAVFIAALALVSDMLAGIFGTALAGLFGLYGLARLSRMAGLGGRVRKMTDGLIHFAKRIGLIR